MFGETLDTGFHSNYEIYTGGFFRSQKGGSTRDEAGKYQSTALGNSEVQFFYKSSSHLFSFILGPRLLASESKVFEKKKESVWDAEGIFGYTTNLHKFRIHLEGGRGWQRLDGFGFLYNGMSNYGQLQVEVNEKFSLAFHSINFKQEEESLKPNVWNHSRKQLTGMSLRSTDFLFWENLQIFHYHYLEPNLTLSESGIFPANLYGSFLYSGLEFRSIKFWQETAIDFSFVRTTGIRKNKTAPWTENSNATNANLFYSSIHGSISEYFIAFSGLFTTKDRNSRTDSDSNGYAAPLAEPRVLGGYSSFLLYQSIYLPNDNVFSEFYNKQKPGYENKGIRMYGIQFGKKFYESLRGDLFINRSSSEIGNGNEMILKLTKQFQGFKEGFVSGSICYATADSNKRIILISEPFTQTEKQKDFLRIYVSAGFQF